MGACAKVLHRLKEMLKNVYKIELLMIKGIKIEDNSS